MTEGWFANEAVVNLKIRQRILPTKDGQSSLRHFDGATMKTYQYPSKASTEVFCRDPLTPESCLEGSGFNPEIPNIPAHLLHGRTESIHSTVDSPQSSFLGLETAVHAIHLDSKATEICNKTCTFDGRLCWGHPVLRYNQEYGINIGNVRIWHYPLSGDMFGSFIFFWTTPSSSHTLSFLFSAGRVTSASPPP